MGFEFYGNPTLDAAYEQARAAAAAWYRDPGDANSAALESANAQMTSILQRYQRGELTPAMQAATVLVGIYVLGVIVTRWKLDTSKDSDGTFSLLWPVKLAQHPQDFATALKYAFTVEN